MQFLENPDLQIETLFDLENKINAMHPNLAQKLGLQVKKTHVDTRKIDKSYLDTFGMVIARFSAKNQLRWICFFKKIFLLAQIILDIILKILILILVKVYFIDKGLLTWSTYQAANSLFTRKKYESKLQIKVSQWAFYRILKAFRNISKKFFIWPKPSNKSL